MALLLWVNPLTGDQRSLVSDLIALVIPLTTVHLCFSLNRKQASKTPLLLGASTIAYAAGQAIYFVERYGFKQLGSPSWAQVGWMAFYPLLMGAMITWPAREEVKGHKLRSALDVVVAAAGLWAFVWVFILGPVVEFHQETLIKTVSEILYPVFDILFLVCLFSFLRRGTDPRFRESARILVGGIVFIVAFDCTYELTILHASSMPSGVVALKWSLCCTAINLAGYLYQLKDRELTDEEEKEADPLERALRVQPWYSLVPYTLIPAVAGLLLYSDPKRGGHPYATGVIFGVLVMILCLLLRQVLTIRENASLLTELQRSYREIKAKSQELKRSNGDLHDALGRLATNNDELAKANAQLAQLITIDGMTGLENHRAFQQRLRLEVEAAKRHRHPLSLIMADVDFFKRYNDEFGHPAGDEVLRQIAKAFVDQLGEKAYPARYGGEEFAVILPYLSANEALNVSERLGRMIASKIGVRRRITMSFGVATLESTWTAETLVSEADRALYAAKSWGRNRTVLVSDLDRRRLSLELGGEGPAEFDPNEPMGLAAILSAGLRNHPQALSIEPDSQLAGGLLTTLELKDVETRDHSERVMWYAMRLAQSMIETGGASMTHQELRSLAYGGLLHDLGKIGVPEHILKFPGHLDMEMRAVIREHPRLGAQIVQRFPTLDMALAVIRNHHERWDGKGYPSGLVGEDIPVVARIFSVVDALEAMTSKRPYSDPIPFEDVAARLHEGIGTMYDPAVIAAFDAVPTDEWQGIRRFESSVAKLIDDPKSLLV